MVLRPINTNLVSDIFYPPGVVNVSALNDKHVELTRYALELHPIPA